MASPFVLEHLHYLGFGQGEDGGLVNFEDDSLGTVVLRDMEIAKRQSLIAYQNGSGAGPLFIENVYSDGGGQAESNNTRSNQWLFTNQRVWARQFNPEPGQSTGSDPEVINTGSTVWVLGSKTESRQHPYIETVSGGRTELLGGWVFLYGQPSSGAPPLFTVDNSDVSLTFQTASNNGITPFPVQVRVIRSGMQKDLGVSDADPSSHNINLFSDRKM